MQENDILAFLAGFRSREAEAFTELVYSLEPPIAPETIALLIREAIDRHDVMPADLDREASDVPGSVVLWREGQELPGSAEGQAALLKAVHAALILRLCQR